MMAYSKMAVVKLIKKTKLKNAAEYIRQPIQIMIARLSG